MDRFLSKAKRLDNKKWVCGYYINELRYDIVNDKEYSRPTIYGIVKDDKVNYKVMNCFDVDIKTLCQCTGLNDDEGILIYENDILRAERVNYDGICESYILIVRYKDGYFYVCDIEDEESNLNKPLSYACESYVKVIDNIHDKEMTHV